MTHATTKYSKNDTCYVKISKTTFAKAKMEKAAVKASKSDN